MRRNLPERRAATANGVAEVLAWETGLYDGNPLANLGRLRLRLLRTARMVVDTGIHAKGRTMDEAAACLGSCVTLPVGYHAN